MSRVAHHAVRVEGALLCVATNMIFVVESVLAFAESGCGDDWCWRATAYLFGVNVTMTETRFLHIVLEH